MRKRHAVDAPRHDPDLLHDHHVRDARRVLALPVEVTGLRWHPFGLFTMPLPKRTDARGTWSRRLHVWHPDGRPVGEASPYGVHTHSGPARSHVLLGALEHHLYAFEEDPQGVWQRACLGRGEGNASLVGHTQATTRAGTTHSLPANQPHGVTKGDGLALSLFEQLDGPKAQEFTTWQRTDVPAEELVRRGPVPPSQAALEALVALDSVLVQV